MEIRRTFFIVLVLLVASTIHLWIYTRNIDLKYDVEGLKRQLSDLKKNVRELEAIAAKKMTLDRIESFAEGKLGMVRPDRIEYIISPSGEIFP